MRKVGGKAENKRLIQQHDGEVSLSMYLQQSHSTTAQKFHVNVHGKLNDLENSATECKNWKRTEISKYVRKKGIGMQCKQ